MPIIPIYQSPFAYEIPNIIAGLDSAQSETFGWNAEVRDKKLMTVVRTSDTVVTITLAASPSYSISTEEVVTATVPASALVTSSSEVVGTPVFTINSISELMAVQYYYQGIADQQIGAAVAY